MPYKDKCGFRLKAKVCTFRSKDCSPENCDMYYIPFESKPIKQMMDKLKQEHTEMQKDILKIRNLKKVVKMEQNNPTDEKVIEFKKKWKKFEDISHGIKYLKRAYEYCRRAGL